MNENGKTGGANGSGSRPRLLTRGDVVNYCMTFPDAYEDYPFHDQTWTVMRLAGSRKGFAFIFERERRIWVNVKCDPDWILFWREAYPGVVPAYHMNKKHWNSLILDNTIPDQEVRRMIAESYDLAKGKPPVIKNGKHSDMV